MTGETTDAGAPRERWLHERIGGAALRASSFVVGAAVLAVALAGLGWRVADLTPALVAVSAAVLVVFVLERRDAGWIEVLVRAAIGGAIGALLAPAALVCARHAGAPERALLELAAELRDPLLPLGISALAALYAPVWALPMLVRARTARVWPQAVAWGLGVGVPLGVVLELARPGGAAGAKVAALTFASTIAGVALPLLERWLGERVDPAAARPLERGLEPLVVWVGSSALLGAVIVATNVAGLGP